MVPAVVVAVVVESVAVVAEADAWKFAVYPFADAARDHGFSRTEFTGQTDYVARTEPLRKRLRPSESFFGRTSNQCW